MELKLNSFLSLLSPQMQQDSVTLLLNCENLASLINAPTDQAPFSNYIFKSSWFFPEACSFVIVPLIRGLRTVTRSFPPWVSLVSPT